MTEITPDVPAPEAVDNTVRDQLTEVIADILDLRSVRYEDLDGYALVDLIESGSVGGRVLSPHDDSTLFTFTIDITISVLAA